MATPPRITAAPADSLLNRKQTATVASVSVATWDRMTAAGKTPAPVRLSAGAIRFRRSDIDLWIALGCPDRRTFEQVQNS